MGIEIYRDPEEAILTHEAQPDPHPGYQLEAEKAQANGYGSLDGSAQQPLAQLKTMVGATSGANGARGSVPQPTAGQQTFLLTGNGQWTDPFAVGAGSFTAIAQGSDPITATATTDVLVPGLTLTPGAGTYMVMWGMTASHNKANQTVFGSIYAAGAIVPYTERQVGGQANNLGNLGAQAIVTVGAGEALEARWRSSSAAGGGQISSPGPRSLVIVRVA